MSIASAITSAQGRVADCYTAISNKGGTLPATQNLANMPTAINSIPSGSSSNEWTLTVSANNYGNPTYTNQPFGTLCAGDLTTYDSTKEITPDSTATTNAGSTTRKVYNFVGCWKVSGACTLFEWSSGSFIKVQTINPVSDNKSQVLVFNRILSDSSVAGGGGSND